MERIIQFPATGKALRELRKQAGVTMFEVGTRLGLQEPVVSLHETGRKPIPEGFAQRYCDALRDITAERAQLVAALYEAPTAELAKAA